MEALEFTYSTTGKALEVNPIFFGKPLEKNDPEPFFCLKAYTYGFQGQEKDDEVKGSGNSYDFGARMHDPRIGRFFALDPLAMKYPFMSPYTFAGNNPIRFIDVNGEGPGDGPFTGQARMDKRGNISIFRLTTLDRKAMNVTRGVAGVTPVGAGMEMASLAERLYNSEMEGTIYKDDPHKDLAREVATQEGDVFTKGAATKVVTSLSLLSEVLSDPTRQELLEEITYSIAAELDLGYKNIVREGLFQIDVPISVETTERTFNTIYNTLDQQLGSMELNSRDDINKAIDQVNANPKKFVDELKKNLKTEFKDEKKEP